MMEGTTRRSGFPYFPWPGGSVQRQQHPLTSVRQAFTTYHSFSYACTIQVHDYHIHIHNNSTKLRILPQVVSSAASKVNLINSI